MSLVLNHLLFKILRSWELLLQKLYFLFLNIFLLILLNLVITFPLFPQIARRSLPITICITFIKRTMHLFTFLFNLHSTLLLTTLLLNFVQIVQQTNLSISHLLFLLEPTDIFFKKLVPLGLAGQIHFVHLLQKVYRNLVPDIFLLTNQNYHFSLRHYHIVIAILFIK